jgi:glycerophosphoryl diester phosphodiesterase
MAISLGADMVEVDTHSTKDGKLVVIHDADVDRTTNGRGAIKEMSLLQISKLDAGKGEKVPTLQEVLRLSRNKIGLMIEIKGLGIERSLVELLQAENATEQVIVTSFMSDAIRKVKKMNDLIQTGQIFSWKIPDVAQKALELKTSCMVPQYALVTNEIVKELHAHHLSIFTWTVNSPSAAKRLLTIGVDGIITNRPDLLTKKKKIGLGRKNKKGGK